MYENIPQSLSAKLQYSIPIVIRPLSAEAFPSYKDPLTRDVPFTWDPLAMQKRKLSHDNFPSQEITLYVYFPLQKDL